MDSDESLKIIEELRAVVTGMLLIPASVLMHELTPDQQEGVKKLVRRSKERFRAAIRRQHNIQDKEV